MRREIDFIDDVYSVTYGDCVRAAGGKRRLRRQGHVRLIITDGHGEHQQVVDLVERTMRLGGTRTFMACPCCKSAVLRLLWDEKTRKLKCRRCWGQTLRYRSQERRRLGTGTPVQKAPPAGELYPEAI